MTLKRIPPEATLPCEDVGTRRMASKCRSAENASKVTELKSLSYERQYYGRMHSYRKLGFILI